MNKAAKQDQSAFSFWLRTGRVPIDDRVELKFNPWHDPADGRFTFAGSGRNHGAGGANPARRSGNPVAGTDNRDTPRIAARLKAEASRAERPVRQSGSSGDRGAVAAQPEPTKSRVRDRSNRDPSNQAAEFVGGVGEGLYDVAEGTVKAAYSTLTTNPVTTVRNVGRGIAGMIDKAIVAEDTPARVQVSRAAEAIGNASARDIGHATGSLVGNVALAVAPGAALTKVSAVRRLRGARPRATYDPPQIGLAKETLNSDQPWKAYNDSATGAQPGYAPTLMRTMPNGSKRPVKFDGVEGEYLIDRKWSVSGRPRAVAQILRQSEVLAQHRLIGTWEVPNQVERNAAIKLFKKLNVTNIKVRVVKP